MYTIGVDIGGTNARVALLDQNFNILQKEVVQTKDAEFDRILNLIIAIIKQVDPENKADVIGVCSPGPIDKEAGMILDAPNLPLWRDKPFVDRIKEATGRHVYLTNDANAAAIAQAIDDDHDMLVFITVSTGVGGGIVYKKQLIEGKYVYAGEFGTMIISDEDRNHSQLYPGTLESLCSGTALALEASKRYDENISTKELFSRYEQGDVIASVIVERWVEHFSRAIANLLQIIEPEVFYLGGSVITNNPWLLDKIKEKTKDKVYEGLKDKIELRLAKYADDAGIVGAAFNGYVSEKGERL